MNMSTGNYNHPFTNAKDVQDALKIIGQAFGDPLQRNAILPLGAPLDLGLPESQSRSRSAFC